MKRLLLSIPIVTLLLMPFYAHAKTEQIRIPLPKDEHIIYDVDGNYTILKIDSKNIQLEEIRGKESKKFVLEELPTLEETKPEVIYKDIVGLWAEEDIYKMVDLGLIKGYPDGTFRPNNKITRAEFGTILARILEMEQAISPIDTLFKDVPKESWFYDYLAKLESAGNLNSKHYQNAILQPNEPITREEMALWVAKEIDGQLNNLAFTDANQIRFKDEVANSVSTGLLKGYPDGSFQPKGDATRAEAVTILVRLLQVKGII